MTWHPLHVHADGCACPPGKCRSSEGCLPWGNGPRTEGELVLVRRDVTAALREYRAAGGHPDGEPLAIAVGRAVGGMGAVYVPGWAHPGTDWMPMPAGVLP